MKKNYAEILIVDKNGIIVFSGGVSKDPFDPTPEELLGQRVDELFQNLNDETSTLLKAVKKGVATIDYEQELITHENERVIQISSTYPITNGVEIVGAIEFCEFKKRIRPDKIVRPAVDKPVYRKNNTRYTIDDFITTNSEMLDMKRKVIRVSKTDSTVLIYGETGTGKEIIAQAIHNLSNRAPSPFVSLNCGAIPSNLIESILFGTVKGGFTDAENKIGIIESAQNGTIFLDEINSLPIDLQVKLLKVIEDQRIRRIGDAKEIDLNIRFISAINEEISELMKEKRFREDLYYRLSVVQLNLLPLARRKEDILLLSNYYIDYYNEKFDRKLPHLPQKIIEVFHSYTWPGNVRELRNAIEGIFNLSENNSIKEEYLPERITGSRDGPARNRSQKDLKDLVDEYELKIVQDAYIKHNHNMASAAKELGISRQLFKYKLEKIKG